MSNIEHALPVGIGETILVPARKLAGPVDLVVVWRFACPRFLVGGVLDRPSQLSLQVLLKQGHEHRLSEGEIPALGTPARASFFLPFTGGDLVLVVPSRAHGGNARMGVVSLRLQTTVLYRVWLASTPAADELEVDAGDLLPWLRT